MREPFPLSGWLIIGLLIAVAVFLLAGPHSQAASNSFTLTEIDPTGNNYAGYWQYQAQTNSPQETITSRQDSPWHWRHYDSTDINKEHIKCDDIQYLYPANPNSPDTVISADGQTIIVNTYQAIDSVWVCFALECDDGSYSFALMRNLQTEKTITSGACGGGSNNRINQPDHPAIDPIESDDDKLDPANNVDPVNNPNGQGEGGAGDNDQNNQDSQGQDNGQDGNQRNDQDQGNDQNDQGQNQDDNNQPGGEGQTNQSPTTEDPPIDKTPSK